MPEKTTYLLLTLLGLGPAELAIVLFLVLIIFGVGKLPQVGEALGKSIRNFKKASDDEEKKTLLPISQSSEQSPSSTKNTERLES